MSVRQTGWMESTLLGHICHLFEPQRPNDHGFVVVYLHGVHLQQLHDKPAFTKAFEKHGLRIVAPITQRSWWCDRICEEFDSRFSAEEFVLRHVVPFASEQWQARPPGLALLGTSMGGQGALRLAYKYPNVFPTVAAISPAIDFHTRVAEGDEALRRMYRDEEEARQDTATLHIHPLNWPRNQWFCCDPTDTRWFDSSDRLRMKLFSLGVPYSCDLESSGGGHGFEYYQLMASTAVDFLAESLEKERLRQP